MASSMNQNPSSYQDMSSNHDWLLALMSGDFLEEWLYTKRRAMMLDAQIIN